MKKYVITIATVLLALAVFFPTITSASSPNVSVKLKNHLGNKTIVNLDIKGEYTLDESTTLVAGKEYKLRNENNALVLYDGTTRLKTFSTSFTITPKEYGTNNYVSINGRPYLGTMKFIEEGSYVRPVNTLPLEDYLKSVVPHEMPASWSLEALKAQAVAARTYALGKLGSIIDDTTTYQVYGGYNYSSPIYSKSTLAVEETAGKVLRQNGKLIGTYYSASNGGHTESNSNYGWSDTALSYLPSKPDPYDPKNDWDLTITKQQIDTSKLNLIDPSGWWNSVSEAASTGITERNAISSLKQYLYSKNTNAADIKIVNVPHISMTNEFTINDEGNPTGKQTKGNVTVDFFMKNKDGSFARESGQDLPENYSKTLEGSTRYDTSASIAADGWSNGAETVVLGRGDVPLDALAGSVLASKFNSPLLLTESSKLPDSVIEQIKKINPTSGKVYILGGTAAIQDSVLKQIRGLGLEPIRVSGGTRYETAVEIAELIGNSKQAFITSGDNSSPDALSIASYAASQQIPILVNSDNSLKDSVKTYLIENGIEKVVIIGGTAAISDDVKNQIAKVVNETSRIFGTTRYETSLEIAKTYNFDYNNLFFAQGGTFIDALPGAVLAATKQAPLLLTSKSELPAETKKWIKGMDSRPYIYYLGGNAAIDTKAKTDVREALIGDIKLHRAELKGIKIGTIRSMFGGTRFKSYHVTNVEDKNGILKINGLGNGHAIGMSQYGAYERAKAGQKYDEILSFYYPGTTLTNY